MTRTRAEAFNEWMRLYTDEPEKYEAQFRTCATFLAETKAGTVPTYGEECAAYLAKLEAGT